jgi:hypothetical protein
VLILLNRGNIWLTDSQLLLICVANWHTWQACLPEMLKPVNGEITISILQFLLSFPSQPAVWRENASLHSLQLAFSLVATLGFEMKFREEETLFHKKGLVFSA